MLCLSIEISPLIICALSCSVKLIVTIEIPRQTILSLSCGLDLSRFSLSCTGWLLEVDFLFVFTSMVRCSAWLKCYWDLLAMETVNQKLYYHVLTSKNIYIYILIAHSCGLFSFDINVWDARLSNRGAIVQWLGFDLSNPIYFISQLFKLYSK